MHSLLYFSLGFSKLYVMVRSGHVIASHCKHLKGLMAITVVDGVSAIYGNMVAFRKVHFNSSFLSKGHAVSEQVSLLIMQILEGYNRIIVEDGRATQIDFPASLAGYRATRLQAYKQHKHAASSSTHRGITGCVCWSKYHAPCGTSYSATSSDPTRGSPGGLSTEAMREMKW